MSSSFFPSILFSKAVSTSLVGVTAVDISAPAREQDKRLGNNQGTLDRITLVGISDIAMAHHCTVATFLSSRCKDAMTSVICYTDRG